MITITTFISFVGNCFHRVGAFVEVRLAALHDEIAEAVWEIIAELGDRGWFLDECVVEAIWETDGENATMLAGWAANLHNLPTIAYSGELDIQKQAADIMEVALERISPEEVKEKLDADEGYVYLDVRSTAEFADGHAPGAVNVPLRTIIEGRNAMSWL